MSGNRSSFGALRNRQLSIYLGGAFISNSGTWFQNIAQALLVHRLTDGNTFWVGVTGFSQFVAVIVLAPWAGSLADRVDRRRLLILTQLGSLVLTLGLALLAASGHATVPAVIGIALLLGVGNAFSTPASKALLPGLVPREAVGQAIALDSATFNLSRVVGPLGGALVVAELGVATAFLCNALSYVGFIIALLLVRSPEQSRGLRHSGRLRDAWHVVRGDRRLLAALAVTAAVSMATDPVLTLGPAIATEVYRRADTFAGVIVGAFGVGALIAAVTISPRMRDAQRRLLTLVGVMAAGMLALVVLPWAVPGLIAITVAGYGFFAANTQATTVLQLGIADEHRGRVSALWSIAFLGTKPIASLVTGSVAIVLGPRIAASLVLVPLAVAIWFVARVPDASARTVTVTTGMPAESSTA